MQAFTSPDRKIPDKSQGVLQSNYRDKSTIKLLNLKRSKPDQYSFKKSLSNKITKIK